MPLSGNSVRRSSGLQWIVDHWVPQVLLRTILSAGLLPRGHTSLSFLQTRKHSASEQGSLVSSARRWRRISPTNIIQSAASWRNVTYLVLVTENDPDYDCCVCWEFKNCHHEINDICSSIRSIVCLLPSWSIPIFLVFLHLTLQIVINQGQLFKTST